jgi:hypothetical protein
MSLRDGKSRRWENDESEFQATIEYVPLPEVMKRSTYREWVRLYLKSEMERLRKEGKKERKAGLVCEP